MSVAPLTRLYTAQDLERLSSEGDRYELLEGELREMAPPGGEHGGTTMDLSMYANYHVRAQRLGRGFGAETGFLIARNPDTVLAPDFAFIAMDRLPPQPIRGYVPVVPDLVLETRSPSDTRRGVREKVGRWLAAGVRVVWEMDPEARVVTVHRAGAEPKALGIDNTLDGGDVLPGFSLPLRDVFWI